MYQNTIKSWETIGIHKLDKNVRIVVYPVSYDSKVINEHLESIFFTILQSLKGKNMSDTCQKPWDQIVQYAANLSAEIELPEELSKMLLQLIAHLQATVTCV